MMVTLSRSHAGHCPDSLHGSDDVSNSNPGSNTLPSGLTPSCRSRMQRQAEPSGWTLMWSTPPENKHRVGYVRPHDIESRSAVLPDPRLQESSLSLRVLVRVVRDRRLRVDVESQAVRAKHLGPGRDQVHLLGPGDDVHGDVESAILQE